LASAAPASALPASAPAEPPALPAASAPEAAAPLPASGDQLAAASLSLRAALVNILCIAPSGSGLRSISGSGVIVGSSGYILTNAHIGQYFLLADRGVACVIRTGTPAKTAYLAAPVFVSPAWLAANPNVLVEASPTGTGEHDLALLAISSTASGAPLPAAFPHVPLASAPPALGEPVVIGSYAAQFLELNQIENALSPTLVYGSVADLFTFAVNSVDVVSLGGTAAAQEGSSGGGAIDASGHLVATITTSTTQGDTASRRLDAITASYIRREYAAEASTTLDALLSEPPAAAIAAFAPQIPSLESGLSLPN
jgi:S1-C subfamily serine protease